MIEGMVNNDTASIWHNLLFRLIDLEGLMFVELNGATPITNIL